MTKIETLEDLKEACLSNDGQADFFIALNGNARSSKDIRYDGVEWDVLHSISDSWEEYETDDEFIKGEPFLMEAMSKGALFKD